MQRDLQLRLEIVSIGIWASLLALHVGVSSHIQNPAFPSGNSCDQLAYIVSTFLSVVAFCWFMTVVACKDSMIEIITTTTAGACLIFCSTVMALSTHIVSMRLQVYAVNKTLCHEDYINRAVSIHLVGTALGFVTQAYTGTRHFKEIKRIINTRSGNNSLVDCSGTARV